MSELIHNLGIDWKVLLAQIVNFALLLFLLKKFAYKPVLNALNERRERIEEAIARSRQVDEKMESIEQMKEEVLDKARSESQTIIKKAEESAQRVQEDILAKTQEKADAMIQDAEKKISAEREKLIAEVKQNVAQLVGDAVERSVGDVLDGGARDRLVRQATDVVQGSQQ